MLDIQLCCSCSFTISSLLLLRPDREAKYCDDDRVSVCVCVCLSASISLEIHVLSPPDFCARMAVARSSSGGVAIRYVLPVLWMTSYLRISRGSSTWPPTCSLGFGYKRRVGIPVAGQWIHTHEPTFWAPRCGPTRPQRAC